MNRPIYVTKPLLPALDDYYDLLSEIWDSGILTNAGEMHNNLERMLADYLDVPFVSLFNNGTSALFTAIKSLDLPVGSEIITTPYTFIATAHSILWCNHVPVFVDVDPMTCNISPQAIEDAVSERTSAILAVHCYGNPCDVEELDRVAQKYELKLIYDAAHAFGVKIDGTSVLNWGELSVLSFHATKVFNTIEGGAIVTKTIEAKNKVDSYRNFGFIDEVTVNHLGFNGKMSEVNSAFGILQLASIDAALEKRRLISQIYRKRLGHLNCVSFLNVEPNVIHNGSYFPIFVNELARLRRDSLYEKLRSENVFSRRYFYPLVTQMEPYISNLAYYPSFSLREAEKLANDVLCLPIYPDLSLDDVERICSILCGCLQGE